MSIEQRKCWHGFGRLGVASILAIVLAHGQSGTGAPPTERTTAQEQKAEAGIEGRLVRFGTGEPVAGVDIWAMSPTATKRISPQKTDAGGRFRFDGLEPGRYGLVLIPSSGYSARDTLVVLKGGQKATGIEMKAYPGATVAGRVKDAAGHPVSGVTVSPIRIHLAGGRWAPQRSLPAFTDAAGEYKITGLKPGRYTLLAELKRSAIERRTWSEKDEEKWEPEPRVADVRTYYPDAGSADLATMFTLEAGQALETMDVTLARQETYCVRSRVDGTAPQEGSHIRVQIATDLYMGAAEMATGDFATGEGFEVCGLPAGSYRLQAGLIEAEGGSRYASEPFSLTRRSLRLPDVTLRPLVQLPGRLTIDSTSDARALPRPVHIYLDSIGRLGIAHEQPTADVAQPGAFVVPAVFPDEYWLNVRAPSGFYVKSASIAGVDVLRAPLHAAGGELIVVLGQNGSTLTVQVTDPDNHPVPSADVIVGRDPLAPSYAPNDLMPVLCDQNGQVTLKGIAPGKYRLLAYADMWVDPASAGDFFLANSSHGEALNLEPGESRTLSVTAMDLAPKK
jgi:protocatechuate 3,4-dioxygenase beta subunit